MNNSMIGAGESPCVGEVHPRAWQQPRGRTNAFTSRLGSVCITGLLAAVLVWAPSLAMAEEGKAAEVSKESGLGAAAAISSLIYGPTKILYATGGFIIGSFAYAFTAGDSEVAGTVFTRSLRGDYVITPEMLRGEESLEFIGRDVDETTAPTPSVASTTPAYEDTEYDDLGW